MSHNSGSDEQIFGEEQQVPACGATRLTSGRTQQPGSIHGTTTGNEPMEIGATSAFTSMANRHPADEIADIRDQIAVLKTRETKLRDALLNAEQSERIGEEWIAEITQRKS